MKGIIILSCVLAVAVTGKYTTKYDGTNVKEILENDRLFEGYFKCINDEGPCTPDGKELKDHIEEALKDGCAECSDVQKENTELVIHYIIEKKPEAWNKLCEKYDPSGQYRKKYEEQAKAKGINYS